MLEGRGSTQLEFADGRKRSFEWGPRSFFAIPLNAKYRHFNGSGTQRALLVETTTLPMIMNIFHNEEFIFNTPGRSRTGSATTKYYAGEGDLYMLRPGNNMWETNFVPDLGTIELTPWEDRGPGSSNIMFVLADGIMHAHISEIAPATYKKAHRHGAGTHVLTLTGDGYSLLWNDGERDFERVDWTYGVVFPPCEGQFHQHFVTSNHASRYVATGLGNLRYPLTERNGAQSFATDERRSKRVAQRQRGRRPDRVRGSGSAHPPDLARGDAQARDHAPAHAVAVVGSPAYAPIGCQGASIGIIASSARSFS